jgi:LmbE family N-acetylglucosaminyl deacetylase
VRQVDQSTSRIVLNPIVECGIFVKRLEMGMHMALHDLINDFREPALLAVLAHPDDETFGTGGTLAYYARRGVKVYLVCATRGEAGEVDEEYLRGFQSIGERREHELRCAAEHLGLAGVFFLNYRDSGMPGAADNSHPRALAAQPVEKVAGEVAHYIRKLHPQVVITFDPIGGYRHPDHIAIHKAATTAFHLAGDRSFSDPEGLPPYQPARLYYQTIPRRFLRFIVWLLRLVGRDPRRFGRNKDIDLASIAEVDFPTHAIIDYRAVADIRDRASRCHASQGGSSLTGGLFGPIRRYFASKELYMQAYPEPNGKVERDLFAGVTALPPFQRRV